jgi:hypothetical protein
VAASRRVVLEIASGCSTASAALLSSLALLVQILTQLREEVEVAASRGVVLDIASVAALLAPGLASAKACCSTN